MTDADRDFAATLAAMNDDQLCELAAATAWDIATVRELAASSRRLLDAQKYLAMLDEARTIAEMRLRELQRQRHWLDGLGPREN